MPVRRTRAVARPGPLSVLILFVLVATPRPSAAQDTAGSPLGIQDRSSGLGLSREYNPAMGGSLILGGEYLSRKAAKLGLPSAVQEGLGQTGLQFNEAEISISAAVDPYFRADLIVAFAYDHGDFSTDIEEGYVTTLFLRGFTIRAGKFYLPFGRHNALHTHAFPFIDAPLPLVHVFGPEGLNMMAVEGSWLIPLPWFAELTVDVGSNDNQLFHSPEGHDLVYGGRLRTMVDLNDDTTLELGGSYFAGKDYAGGWTHVYGADMTLRWRPARREMYHQVVWQTEYVRVSRQFRPAVPQPGTDAGAGEQAAWQALKDVPGGSAGFYSYLAGQVGRRWWLEARYDAFGFPWGRGDDHHRVSGLVTFVTSEFAALRLQYGYLFGSDAHQVLLQANFGIGAHPAHAY
jgi:hypothetical protein